MSNTKKNNRSGLVHQAQLVLRGRRKVTELVTGETIAGPRKNVELTAYRRKHFGGWSVWWAEWDGTLISFGDADVSKVLSMEEKAFKHSESVAENLKHHFVGQVNRIKSPDQ